MSGIIKKNEESYMKIKQIRELENLKKYDAVLLPFIKNEEINLNDTGEFLESIKSIIKSSDFKDNEEDIYTTSILKEDNLLKVIFLEIRENKINIENIFQGFAKGFKKARQ